jgi:ABC-type lipoprotein release transport system permease subunit
MQEIDKVDLWLYPKRPLSIAEIAKIGAIEGVEQFSPFCQKSVVVTLPNGIKQGAVLLGVENLGLPRTLTQGKLAHLQLDRSIIADESSIKSKFAYRYRGVKKNFKIGQYVLVGDHKMLLGGLCRLKEGGGKIPLLYTSYNNAIKLFDLQSDDITVYLLKAKGGESLSKLSETIERTLPVETKLHKIVLANHIQPSSPSRIYFVVWTAILMGILGYLLAMETVFFRLGKEVLLHRQLGAPFSFVATLFIVKGSILFLGGWILATIVCYSLQFCCQMVIPVVWGYSLFLFLTTTLVTLGFIIRGSYASYRV